MGDQRPNVENIRLQYIWQLHYSRLRHARGVLIFVFIIFSRLVRYSEITRDKLIALCMIAFFTCFLGLIRAGGRFHEHLCQRLC